MPTDAETEAAMEAMKVSGDSGFRMAEVALTAAEKVRDQEIQQEAVDRELARRKARTQNIHTCHSECPCQTGGKPVPDFIEARTQPEGNHTNHEGITEFESDDDRTPKWKPETGQPIPDEVGAKYEPIPHKAWEAGMAEMNYMTAGKADGILVSEIITAALPHLEAAWREAIHTAAPAQFYEAIERDAAAAIRADERAKAEADTLAKVRERVEAERLGETDDPLAGISATGRAAVDAWKAYNRAIDNALAAIEEVDDV